MTDIRIAGRVGFERIEDLENRFKGIDFPIELALPWRYEDLWLPMKNRLNEVMDFFLKSKLEIRSIHATQGKISDEAFLIWGKESLEFAEALNIKHVTVHPNQVKSNRIDLQEKARSYINRMERDSSARFSIETFSGKRRLFWPKEIIEKGLQMTLDVAHIHDDSFVHQIIESYWHNISEVHLSAKGNGEHHLPIDTFCIGVVKELQSRGWSGSIILEYLPWHHYRLKGDIDALREHLINGKELTLEPVSDKFKTEPSKWGYNYDGT